VSVYNQAAAPLEWRKAGVHPVDPKQYYAKLRK
jgi:hypothetical protein